MNHRPQEMPDDVATGARLERLRSFTRAMDDGIRIPGTRFRIGLDPVLGLVPGAGDVAGAVLSAAILIEAVRRRVSTPTLLRMVLNIAVDTGLGTVPLVGDAFDAAWKSNRRNLALLEQHVAGHPVGRPVGLFAVALLAVALILLCLGLAAGAAILFVRFLAAN